MSLVFYEQSQAIVLAGEFPPVDDWDNHIQHRDNVARQIANHSSNGFQYGVDISAGNVLCGYLLMVGGEPIICVIDDEGNYPEGSFPATYCFYESWR